MYERTENPPPSSSPYCTYDDQKLQLFTSSLFLAGLVMSFFAAGICRRWGRKATMLIASIFFLVGGWARGLGAGGRWRWALVVGAGGGRWVDGGACRRPCLQAPLPACLARCDNPTHPAPPSPLPRAPGTGLNAGAANLAMLVLGRIFLGLGIGSAKWVARGVAGG